MRLRKDTSFSSRRQSHTCRPYVLYPSGCDPETLCSITCCCIVVTLLLGDSISADDEPTCCTPLSIHIYRDNSSTLTVSSFEALTKKAPLLAAATWLTACRCSARCATCNNLASGVAYRGDSMCDRAASLQARCAGASLWQGSRLLQALDPCSKFQVHPINPG